jgi:hypothetical protein
METEGTVWATVYGNGKGLFGQPFMEMKGNCLGNRLWKRKRAVWATVYGNERKLLGQPLMEIVSYGLWK